MLDLAARYEHFVPNHSEPDASTRRITAGVNFYFFRPHAKLMLNYRHDLARPDAPLLLAQLQYMF